MNDYVTGGGVVKKTKRVYLTSGTVYEGYAVCYDWDHVGDIDGNAFTTTYGQTLGTTLDYWSDGRQLCVNEPDSLNNLSFAGVIDKCSNGVTGPNWVQINTPGSVCKIFSSLSARGVITSSGATPQDTILSTRNRGDILTFTIATVDNGEFKYRGFPGRGSARVLEVASTTDQLIYAELQDGEESGGVQMIACTTTLSAVAGVTVTMGGITLLSATAAASGAGDVVVSAGSYIGMKKRFMIRAANSNFTLYLSASVPMRVPFMTGAAALTANGVVSADSWAVASAAGGEYLDLLWDGTRWGAWYRGGVVT